MKTRVLSCGWSEASEEELCTVFWESEPAGYKTVKAKRKDSRLSPVNRLRESWIRVKRLINLVIIPVLSTF